MTHLGRTVALFIAATAATLGSGCGADTAFPEPVEAQDSALCGGGGSTAGPPGTKDAYRTIDGPLTSPDCPNLNSCGYTITGTPGAFCTGSWLSDWDSWAGAGRMRFKATWADFIRPTTQSSCQAAYVYIAAI